MNSVYFLTYVPYCIFYTLTSLQNCRMYLPACITLQYMSPYTCTTIHMYLPNDVQLFSIYISPCLFITILYVSADVWCIQHCSMQPPPPPVFSSSNQYCMYLPTCVQYVLDSMYRISLHVCNYSICVQDTSVQFLDICIPVIR